LRTTTTRCYEATGCVDERVVVTVLVVSKETVQPGYVLVVTASGEMTQITPVEAPGMGFVVVAEL